MNTHVGKRLFLVAGVIVAVLVVLGSHSGGPGLVDAQGLAPCTFPGAGTDSFPSSAAELTFELHLGQVPPYPQEELRLEGPTQIDRSDPDDSNGNLRREIHTEILSMSLAGTSTLLGGPVLLRESPTLASTGLIETKLGTSTDFPADSFFDVFFEMDTLFGTAYNIDPFTMAYDIYCIPPEGAAYQPPPAAPTFVDVYMFDPPVKVGRIMHAKHIPLPEKPLFTVRPFGPSGLNPAHVYTIAAAGGPPIVAIADAALGVAGAAGDDVDALSQTEPIWDVLLPDIRFSVDDAPPAGLSLGLPGTGVRAEATLIPPEAHGDEFNVPAPGTNALFMDEGLFGLLVSDDIDGLAEPLLPPPFVAFSLAAGSPALVPAGATEADILVPGPLPLVAVPGALLGLLPGDDLDALCWFDFNFNVFPDPPPFDFYLFSLTPASPTLGIIPATPDDLLAPALPPAVPLPFVAIAAPAIGLRGAGGPDDADALKCLFPDFLVEPPDTDGDTVIDDFDNCPDEPNGDQPDFEGDRVGDKCDDSDIDYFIDYVELYLPTDPLDDCSETSTPNDEDPDAWPVDMDDDQDADIVDVLKFKPVIMTSVPPSPSRFDFDADGDIDIVDVLKYKPIILTSCTP